MKAIGRTNLGHITVTTAVNYKFMVVDEDCGAACPNVEVIPVVTQGKLEVTPSRILTDENGIGECQVYVPRDGAGRCDFKLVPVSV
jgi:hypothetical protein